MIMNESRQYTRLGGEGYKDRSLVKSQPQGCNHKTISYMLLSYSHCDYKRVGNFNYHVVSTHPH